MPASTAPELGSPDDVMPSMQCASAQRMRASAGVAMPRVHHVQCTASSRRMLHACTVTRRASAVRQVKATLTTPRGLRLCVRSRSVGPTEKFMAWPCRWTAMPLCLGPPRAVPTTDACQGGMGFEAEAEAERAFISATCHGIWASSGHCPPTTI